MSASRPDPAPSTVTSFANTWPGVSGDPAVPGTPGSPLAPGAPLSPGTPAGPAGPTAPSAPARFPVTVRSPAAHVPFEMIRTSPLAAPALTTQAVIAATFA